MSVRGVAHYLPVREIVRHDNNARGANHPPQDWGGRGVNDAVRRSAARLNCACAFAEPNRRAHDSELRAIADAEFCERIVQMRPDGCKFQIKLPRNLLVGKDPAPRARRRSALASRQLCQREPTEPPGYVGRALDALERLHQTGCDQAEQVDLVAIEIGMSVLAPDADVADAVAAIEGEQVDAVVVSGRTQEIVVDFGSRQVAVGDDAR